MQACKPGSVTLTISKGPYHLSGPNITIGINRPTHPAHSPFVHHSARPKDRRRHGVEREFWAGNPSSRRFRRKKPDLFGLSTRKVFTAINVTINAVGPYPTISPLPQRKTLWRYIFCCTICSQPTDWDLPVRKYGALRCPDFPPWH